MSAWPRTAWWGALPKRVEGKEGDGVQAQDEGALRRHQPASQGLGDDHRAGVPCDFSLTLSVKVHSGPVGAGSLLTLGKLRQGVKKWPIQ